MWELILLVSTLTTMALIPLLMRIAPRVGLVDEPDERKLHGDPVPRVGGIAMVVSSVIPLLIWLPPREDLLALLVGVAVLFVFGVWDDRADLDYRLKFSGQVAAAVIVVMGGGVLIERLPFTTWTLPYFIGAPFTVFVLVAVTNAINLSDGLDGLAGGTMFLALGAIALMAFLAQDYTLTACAVAIFGGLLGFLRFNSFPARVFMGDTGSQFLGFSTISLAIILSERSNTAMSPAVPLLLLGFPVLDTLAVMAQRWREGRSPFSPDRNHLHHKLLAVGLSHYEAVVLLYGAQAFLVSSAFFFRYSSDAFLLALYGVFCSIVLGFFHLAARRDWHVRSAAERHAQMDGWVRRVRRRPWPQTAARAPRFLATAALPIFLVGAALVGEHLARDVGALAMVMAIVLFMAQFTDSPVGTWSERLAVYVAITIAAYCLEFQPGPLAGFGLYVNAAFVVLAIALVGVIRFSGKMVFRVSPMDFLVTFLVLIIPFVSGLPVSTDDLGAFAFKFLVLCYAAEMLLARGDRSQIALRVGVFAGLGIAAFRGLVE